MLQAQEEANSDKASLQVSLENANGRSGELKAELDTCGEKLNTTQQVTLQLREDLDQAGKDLLTEKRANRTVSLEKSLSIADSKIGALSTDLVHKTEHLERETAEKSTLIIENARLQKELSTVAEEKEASEKSKEKLDGMYRSQAMVQNLQTDEISKSRLLDQLQTQCTLYDAE